MFRFYVGIRYNVLEKHVCLCMCMGLVLSEKLTSVFYTCYTEKYHNSQNIRVYTYNTVFIYCIILNDYLIDCKHCKNYPTILQYRFEVQIFNTSPLLRLF